jgi:hypothetical protein
VATAGARYLAVAPLADDPAIPIALTVTPVCPGGQPRYAMAPFGPDNVARVVEDPSFAARLTASQWGGTVFLTGIDVVPNQAYHVQADCGLPESPRPTAPSSATTYLYGDAAGVFSDGAWTPPDGEIDVLDLTAQLAAFASDAGAPTLYASDQLGCQTDRIIDIIDILASLDGFAGKSFAESSHCTVPCP